MSSRDGLRRRRRWMFGTAGREHMERTARRPSTSPRSREKNHRHSANNPYAQFQDDYTLERSRRAKMIYEPLTRLQCSPTSDGSAAAVAGQRATSSSSTASPARPSRSSARRWSPTCRRRFDDAQAPRHRRRRHDAQGGRARSTSRPASARTTSTSSSCTTASRPTSCSPTRRSGSAPRARAATSSTPATPPTAAMGRQPVGRSDLQGSPARGHRPRPVRRAHLAAARHGRRAPGRRRARSRCSTTSASAAPPSSRSTGPPSGRASL